MIKKWLQSRFVLTQAMSYMVHLPRKISFNVRALTLNSTRRAKDISEITQTTKYDEISFYKQIRHLGMKPENVAILHFPIGSSSDRYLVDHITTDQNSINIWLLLVNKSYTRQITRPSHWVCQNELTKK